mmetsp:Transcript_51313/g.153420  ORF Transcript_51313/g.153420 Transcript_51313/m.153420 type:complete len:223 (+) Transcript_51313:587-1255(+)
MRISRLRHRSTREPRGSCREVYTLLQEAIAKCGWSPRSNLQPSSGTVRKLQPSVKTSAPAKVTAYFVPGAKPKNLKTLGRPFTSSSSSVATGSPSPSGVRLHATVTSRSGSTRIRAESCVTLPTTGPTMSLGSPGGAASSSACTASLKASAPTCSQIGLMHRAHSANHRMSTPAARLSCSSSRARSSSAPLSPNSSRSQRRWRTPIISSTLMKPLKLRSARL